MIRVLYFASLRERLGVGAEELPDAPNTVQGLVATLRERGSVWAEVLAEGEPVLVSRNHEMASPETALSDGDEVGIFPPVTGG